MGKRKRARVSEQKQARQVEEEEEQQQSDVDHNPTSTNEKTLYEVIKNYIQNLRDVIFWLTYWSLSLS